MALLIQGIFSGFALGAIYSLIALGYSIIFSTMRMGHFAQGEFFAIGAFVGYQFLVKWEVHILLAFTAAIVGTSVLMLIVERITYRPMYTREGMGLLISTMGMMYIVQWIAKIIWGNEPKRMPPMFGEENVTYPIRIFNDEVRISRTDLLIILICGMLMLFLALFMKYSKAGIAMSAVSMNRKAAELMGVKLTTIISYTYVLAAAEAAIAGMLMAPRFSVVFTMGTAPGNRAMTAAVMGGFGSMPGAMIGGIMMGVIETLGAFYISTLYRDLFTFIILITVLFWRPQGVLGRKLVVKV